MTTIVISLTVSEALAEEDASLVFPGDPVIGSDLATFLLGCGAGTSIFSVIRLAEVMCPTHMRSL